MMRNSRLEPLSEASSRRVAVRAMALLIGTCLLLLGVRPSWAQDGASSSFANVGGEGWSLAVPARIERKALRALPAPELLQGSITGTVTDATTGNSIPGVNVLIDGTQRGAATGAGGVYEIAELEPGTYSLTASFIGYETETRENVVVEDGAVTTVDFVLTRGSQALDEVVVVGYGEELREDLTGAISSVTTADLEDDVSTTIDEALQGRVAGAIVTRNSGKPGGDVSIRIRGLNTINSGSAEPLYVIDGVPVEGNGDGITNPLATINPQDIESIDVLKDASSAAIYGSRASNGVILITTKQGRAGELDVDFNSSMSTQALTRQLDVMSLPEYATFRSELAVVDGFTNAPELSDPGLLGEGSRWQDALFRRALKSDHSLSVSGGTEDTQYRVSGGYTGHNGIAIESDFRRYTMSLKLDNESTSWLQLGANVNLGRTTQNINVSSDNIIGLAIRQRPDVAIQNPDGSYGGPNEQYNGGTNPIGLARIRTNERRRSQANGGVRAVIKVLDELTLTNELSGRLTYVNGNRFNPSYSFGQDINENNSASRFANNSTFWQMRSYLNYVTALRGLGIDAMAGYEVMESRWEGLRGSRENFPSNVVTELAAGDAATAANGSNSGSHGLESGYSRLRLSYDDRYFLTGNLRADASSNFSPQNRWGFFPSVSGAWKVTSESFMEGVSFLNMLKIRLGYGEVGNESIGGYLYADTYQIEPSEWGNAALASVLGNPGLKWETTKSVNAGVDVGVLGNRVMLTVDVYNRNVQDLLLNVPLPLYSGTTGIGALRNPIDNIGSLNNRGVEMALSTVNLERDGFQWKTDAVFTMNRNNITELAQEGDFIDRTLGFFTTISRSSVGEPAGQFYGYKVAGLFNNREELMMAQNGENGYALPQDTDIDEQRGTWVGDLRFEDLNGDGVINEQDRTFIGDPTPDFQYGFTNRFSFKGLSLSVFLNGSYGNDVFNALRYRSENPADVQSRLGSVFDYARIGKIDPDGAATLENLEVKNPGTTVPRLSATDANGNNRISDRFVEDGSFLRIQNVTLSYRLPRSLTNRVPTLRGVRIYGTGTNLYTFTGYSGYDPEVGGSDALITGIDDGRYPSPRSFTLGLDVTF